MSASSSRTPSNHTSRGRSHKQKKKSKKADIQRQEPPSASRPQSADHHLTDDVGAGRGDSQLSVVSDDVRGVQSREADTMGEPSNSIISTLLSWIPPIISGPSLFNPGNRGVQNRDVSITVDPVLPIPTEVQNTAVEPRSVTMFQGASNFQISNANITSIGGDATIIRFGDGQFTEVQRDLICNYIATLAVLPGINADLKKHILTQLIINLPRAEAVFDDYQTKKKSGPCFEGTRVALLREMVNWVTGKDDSRMYILSGLAGIGKSTVAYTIASRAADLNLLGASFFFSRDEADRSNGKRFFTTIAYQLCVYDERFSKAIGDALQSERGSASTTKDPQEQLQFLIIDPLRSIVQSRARPILVIIDALDECCEDDIRTVLAGLSRLVRDLSSFKIILTTRPQPHLNGLLSKHDGHKLFHLQDIENKIVDGDIRLYLKHYLSVENVREKLPRRQWHANDEEIDTLVRAAGRLFIIASTSVRYILDKSTSNPAGQMQKLLNACAEDHTPFKGLNHFYTIILRNVVPENCDDEEITTRYQSVVGTIISIQRPLAVSALSHLIDTDAEEIYTVLDDLQSVILLGNDDIPRIYHTSFPDYLIDHTRCKDPRLQIDLRIHHTQIAKRCFELANKYLRWNILGLGIPARYMSNEDGLAKDGMTDEQLQEKIPQHLRYACVYWFAHFEAARLEDPDLMDGLAKFVDGHTLHWFEVLSLIGNLDSAHRAILGVLKILKPTSSELYQMLSDASRFIPKFYPVINRSALHTYYSALPFTPSESILYRRYIKEVEHSVCDIKGGPEKWDSLVAILSHGQSTDVVKFSPDSARIASYTVGYVHDWPRKQGQLKIWDAASGMLISTIYGYQFAVANDLSAVATSEDDIISCYTADGSASGLTFTTSPGIQELTLSSESGRVVAALFDKTVWLWDSGNGKLINRFDDFEIIHNDSRFWSFLLFSPTGTRFAYLSVDDIVKLRDGISGRFIADLACGSWPHVTFSGDGTRIASRSKHRDLILWESESGRPICAIKEAGWFVAISPNGSFLATEMDNKMTLWHENRNLLTKIEVLECEMGYIMSFSLNDILAIKTDSGIMLYNVTTHSFISTLPFSDLPRTLAFSPDCTRLACGKHNNVYIWDIQGLDTSSPPSGTTQVTAVALSKDCSRLTCAYDGGIVELWETSPTIRRVVSHQGRRDWISVMDFGPNGRLFASISSIYGTIRLWNGGDGLLHGTINATAGSRKMALSTSVVLVSRGRGATVWELDTLNLVHTFTTHGEIIAVSIADDGNLAATISESHGSLYVNLFDLSNRTFITEFEVSNGIQRLSFLPDNSQLLVQSYDGDMISFNINNKRITKGPTFEQLIQLSNVLLWHGVPVFHCRTRPDFQHYFSALFSQHQSLVPVLRIPNDIHVGSWSQGSSMVALGCEDGRIILLRPSTSYVT